MKKYLVIGNPIDHSLSPRLHNYWIKKNNLKANYDKQLLEKNELGRLILDLREEKIHGINVTVPFKKIIIPFLDDLSNEAKITQSVNTIYKDGQNIIGDNTDITGFEIAFKKTNKPVKNKKVLILGAGGVVASIVFALKKMETSKIYLTNRTKIKALELKKIFPEIEVIEWGRMTDCDIIINATSIGLKSSDVINLDYEKISNKKFFYDVIYNPSMTNFLIKGKENGGYAENGKMMFVYQAQRAFFIWHQLMPVIDNETIELLDT